MSGDEKHFFHIDGLKDKVKSVRQTEFGEGQVYENNFSWKAISETAAKTSVDLPQVPSLSNSSDYNFSGKVLYGGKYAGEQLCQANFSGADLRETDFSKADLRRCDFTSADLSGANLSGADLSGSDLTGAKLRGTNFTGAKMNGVILKEADIQDAILIDVQMDQIALAELQELVEYLAVYYPHKLNLTRINLTLLDISRIDLSQVDLRGVDFTGVDFTGVNIYELDLSECIITPEQIAQALGRVPTPKELKQILAPKKRKKKFRGIDWTLLFHSRGQFGVLDLTKHPGIRVEDLMHAGKKLYKFLLVAEDTDEEILDKFHQNADEKREALAKEHNAQMRRILEEKKEAVRREKEKDLAEKEIDRQYAKEDIERQKQEAIKERLKAYKKAQEGLTAQIISRQGRDR